MIKEGTIIPIKENTIAARWHPDPVIVVKAIWKDVMCGITIAYISYKYNRKWPKSDLKGYGFNIIKKHQ